MLTVLYTSGGKAIESIGILLPEDAGMRKHLMNCLIVGVVGSAPAFAHHGTSVTYQTDKTITLTGTVTEFSFSYPHPQLYFDVKDADGNIQHWGSEFAPTPLMMKQMNVGWARDTIKTGDIITITCNPHRVPGSTACLAKELVVNGKKLTVGPGRPPATGKE
jgi:hypothetical protein